MTQTDWKFDIETRTQREEDTRFVGVISPAWNIGTNPNGGYLVSVVLNALGQVVPHPDPVSVTTHFLRPGSAGEPYDVQVQVIRTGKTLSTARATLSQGDKARIEVLAAFSDLSVPAGVDASITVPPPTMPEPEHCPVRTGDIQKLDLPITQRTDVRLHPELAVPGEAGRAEMGGWIRFVDGRAPDANALVLFTDAFPPSPLAYLGAIGWVPTLELTVNVIRRPAPGWICASFKTDELNQGRMIESGMLWDSTGALVAQSRQLGLVMAST